MFVAVVIFETVTGTKLSPLAPFPSYPSVFMPQHFTTPNVAIAHEW
tara:strand:- start:12689 stop:12826 length:138 start_codon:yes stop_codon:yes gene_type:complete